jgi:NTP pyrophosphatase (non-canonical NTP hydrolase)
MDLAEIVRKLDADLAMNRRAGITDDNTLDVQAICVGEEAGELLGAYRRWAGKARRTGTLAEVSQEIADMLIVTGVFAVMMGIDIEEAGGRTRSTTSPTCWTSPRP